MQDNKNAKEDDKKGGISPVAAAVTGAVVGAGIAVAGAVALKDEASRAKVKKAVVKAKDQAVAYVDDMQKKAEVKTDEVEKNIAEGLEKIEKASKAAKESLTK